VGETLKAFYKLRTAYKTLEGIHTTMSTLELELNYEDTQTPSSQHSTHSASNESIPAPMASSSESAETESKSERSSMEGITLKKSSRNISRTSLSRISTTASRMARDEVEMFTASGCSLCFGLLLLLLGMVPPSLGRVMSIVGFRGGRTSILFVFKM